MLYEHKGVIPKIDSSVFLAPSACVIGDVEIGPESSLWFNVLVRGDVNYIRIGRRTNIQDGTVIHVTHETHPATIGDNVSVGHNVTLHGCHVHDGCLIGIGAILLDGVEIGAGSLVAAGSLVPPHSKIPPKSLVMGRPAQVRRSLTEKECSEFQSIAQRYVSYRDDYLTNVKRIV
jgi:carbonic anhydrase/acetyltransferase-like protein (isoleucine patch superfamily)